MNESEIIEGIYLFQPEKDIKTCTNDYANSDWNQDK